MFPMGLVVQRLGGKIPIQIGLLVNGIISIVTPTVAVWGGWKAVCACRVLQGVSQSGLYPSVHTILAKWVPINERATLVGYVYTGTTLGTVIAFQLSGLLASSAAGWPSTFWVVGVTCLVAFAMVTLFSAATPSDHKTISEEEKKYIMGAAGSSKTRAKTPWKQIFSSKHVWATLVTHFFCGTCFVFLFTQIPTYMHYILGFNIKSSGFLSSLPYIGSFFFCIAYGVLSDYCVNRGYVTLKTTRIVCNTLGQAAPAVCLIAVSYTDNITLAVILIVAAVSLYAGVHSGWMVNYIDMSPNFSGSLMAVGNTGCGAGVLLLPVLVSNIVTELTNRSQWRIVMIVMAGSIFFSNLFYICFMSTDKQVWDEIIDDEDTENEAKPVKT
ncbi:putative inorganic phosphate cotransporter isoform X2 [Choristoneura fumiferana]|uniref:putative inorganic phosphate cotransporter isoform X2 n=1 Tax=Choristoneura fumiferana TaxID=7141 RepID=UPI003D15D0C1